MKVLICALVLAGGMAHADAQLDGAAITALLTGHTVEYDDGSAQVFKAGGDTVFDTSKDAGGRSSTGRWQVKGDRYCSVWPPSDVWACYDVRQGADSVAFVADDGSATLGRLVP